MYVPRDAIRERARMQTIPNHVLDIIVGYKPELQSLINELKQSSERSAAIEQWLASVAIKECPATMTPDAKGLTPSMIRDLNACAAGDPYGAQRNQTWIEMNDARDSWVNVPLAVSLTRGYDRSHLYRIARTGRLLTEQRNGEIWLKRAQVSALERNPAGRPDEAREARRARLPYLRSLFTTISELRSLVNAIVGIGHGNDFIRDLPEQLRIGLLGSSYVQYEGLDLKGLLEKVRKLNESDREALVRAMEYSWSQFNKPEGSLYPEGLFADCL